MSIRAICHWCAEAKSRAFVRCRNCGEMPAEDERIWAWLLSDAYLTEAELLDTQARLQKGTVLAPTESAQRIAQRALGLSVEADSYVWTQWIGLLCLSLVVSSLFPLALWWSKRQIRPYKARQLLWIAAVAGVMDLGLVIYSLSF